MLLLLLLNIYIPIVYGPELPPFNEQMTSVIFDVGLSPDEFAPWYWLDPSPEIDELNDFTYYPPEGYLITNAMFYSYKDSTSRWFRNPVKNVEHCSRAYTWQPGDTELTFIGGEWCFTETMTDKKGYDSYRMRNTSPIGFDVAQFTVVTVLANMLQCRQEDT